MRLELLRQQVGGERVARGDERVRAHRHRRAFVERECERFRFGAPICDESRREPIGQRRGERDPRGRFALAGDRLIDARDRRPIQIGQQLRGARRIELTFEHEQRDQPLEIARRLLRALAALECEIDAP